MRPQPISSVFANPWFDAHQDVVFVHDDAVGLKAIIAIHDTTLGPGLGGCRLWRYESEAEALRDVLRLSRGMTYKNALADLDYGGAKSVIFGDRKTKTPALLRAFGRAVDRLGGRYVSGEDVGITVADMEIIRGETAHVRGIAEGGVGDPSPHTAYGVHVGIRSAAARAFGTDDLTGRRVAVQGLGNVGRALCRLLYEAGARLVVADLDHGKVAAMVSEFDAVSVPSNRIHAAAVDIFAPCALGGGLNERTIPEIVARVVAGAANNQLETSADSRRLTDRGVLYAPDYVINAGGAIAIAHEGPGFAPEKLKAHLERIGAALTQIFERSDSERRPTSDIADRLAEERLAGARF